MVAKVPPNFNMQKREGPKWSYMNSGVHAEQTDVPTFSVNTQTASHQETGGWLTPHTLPFLLHGPNAFKTPSNGVITPCPPGDKEPLLGSNTTAFTSRPCRESLATTRASPGHLGQAHSRGREPWGDSRGWGAKGSAGTDIRGARTSLPVGAESCSLPSLSVHPSILTRNSRAAAHGEHGRAVQPRDRGSV